MMRFLLGTLVVTPGAWAFMETHQINSLAILHRHQSGDWGDLDQHDKIANDNAVEDEDRILSSYNFGKDRLWVITEGDRSATTILLPDEY